MKISPIFQRLYKPNTITHTAPNFSPAFKGLEKDTFELRSKQAESAEVKEKTTWDEAKNILQNNGFNEDRTSYILNKIVKNKLDIFESVKEEYVPGSVLNDVLIMTKYAKPADIQKLVTKCYNPKTKEFNKNYFTIARKFLELGTSVEIVDELTANRRPDKNNYFTEKDIENMFSNLPEITADKDKDFLAFVIDWRFACSGHSGDFDKEAYDLFNKIFASGEHWHNAKALNAMGSLIYMRNSYFIGDKASQKIFRDKFNYIVENAHNPDTAFIAKMLDFNDIKLDDVNAQALIDYTKLGADKDYLESRIITNSYPCEATLTAKKHKSRLEKFEKLKNEGVNPAFILPIIEKPHTDEEIKILSQIADGAAQKRDKLGSVEEPYSDFDIIRLLFVNEDDKNIASNVLAATKIFGVNSFIALMDEGYFNIEDYILDFGDGAIKQEYAQPLLKMINPTECEEVKELEKQIKSLKQELQTITDEQEKRQQYNKINTAVKQKNSILSNAVKDHSQKVKIARIYKALIRNNGKDETDYALSNKLIPFLNPKNDEEKQAYINKLNELLWESNKIDCSDEVKKRLDFSKNPHLESLFQSTLNFDRSFEKIVKLLEKYPEKSVYDALMTLPQNKKTEKILKKFNIDFEKWSKYNPDLKLEISYINDASAMEANAVKNLENEFNDKFFNGLPSKARKNIIEVLKKGGYELVKKQVAEYDEAGFLEDKSSRYRLLKDGKQIDFKDLSKVFKIISDHIAQSDLLNEEYYDDEFSLVIKTFKSHIASRYNEMKSAKQSTDMEKINITIQKADMDNLQHSLFLGNNASCCTAIGSANDWSAPQYVMNKLAQCIEIKDGDKFVGNTMIYPVLIKGKPALFLDNIELKPKYQYNKNIEDGLCEFAKMLAKEVGIPAKNIYAGPNRHKLDMSNFSLKEETMRILGVTDSLGMYFDFLGECANLMYNEDYPGDEYEIYKLNR